MKKKHTSMNLSDSQSLESAIANSWLKIAPFWPLKNIIAVNPMAGFEDQTFEDALKEGSVYFQQKEMPYEMQNVNRESIKWFQVFFDEGQSTIQMPSRHLGLMKSTLSLLRFDNRLNINDIEKRQWLEKLPHEPNILIAETLMYLGIPAQDQELFLTLILTTLPGWAAHVKYRTSWPDAKDSQHPHPVTQSEYLALRLVLTCLIWPNAKQLISWHKVALKNADIRSIYQQVQVREKAYQRELLEKFETFDATEKSNKPDAQLVFCIDVRSEPFRRALEHEGNYETYGFAGFFGVPVSIEDPVTAESYSSCPVLLKPAHTIIEKPNCSLQSCKKGYKKLQIIKRIYQSLKYTFTTPFSLVEIMGIFSGLWMGLRSFAPAVSTLIQSALKAIVAPGYSVTPDIESIDFEKQVAYSSGALKMMGLTSNFASLVVFCGHASTTQNNPYGTALDCGACGGRHGGSNARILAHILNTGEVRHALKKHNIEIPKDTFFLAAEHNTTKDQVEIYDYTTSETVKQKVLPLKKDLELARNKNCFLRCAKMGVKVKPDRAKKETSLRAQDWSQILPEWGLAKNASFIVGPRWLTKNLDLDGRSFLHSYEWEKDKEGASLTTILTAPMIVAQWINAQYFFSTLDNVAFGGGSKITNNITGKIGIIQGNASDLMHGLPLQSVYKTDREPYHQPMRLTVVVHAPKSYIDSIISQQTILQKLFGNGWVHLICHDPQEKKKFSLERDLAWIKIH